MKIADFSKIFEKLQLIIINNSVFSISKTCLEKLLPRKFELLKIKLQEINITET